jgi:hypothetical protein
MSHKYFTLQAVIVIRVHRLTNSCKPRAQNKNEQKGHLCRNLWSFCACAFCAQRLHSCLASFRRMCIYSTNGKVYIFLNFICMSTIIISKNTYYIIHQTKCYPSLSSYFISNQSFHYIYNLIDIMESAWWHDDMKNYDFRPTFVLGQIKRIVGFRFPIDLSKIWPTINILLTFPSRDHLFVNSRIYK